MYLMSLSTLLVLRIKSMHSLPRKPRPEVDEASKLSPTLHHLPAVVCHIQLLESSTLKFLCFFFNFHLYIDFYTPLMYTAVDFFPCIINQYIFLDSFYPRASVTSCLKKSVSFFLSHFALLSASDPCTPTPHPHPPPP